MPVFGLDESVFTVIEVTEEGNAEVVHIEGTSKKPLTDTIGRVVELNKIFNFKKVYADETGLGAGAIDMLKEKGIRVFPVTFTLERKDKMYNNLHWMMENGKIKFPSTPKLINQLSQLAYEYTSSGQVKIHAPERGHDDYPDSLALACSFNIAEPGIKFGLPLDLEKLDKDNLLGLQ